MPIARQRASCSGVVTIRRPKISPFRHRMAAAVSTPSGAPPIPITARTPLPATAPPCAGARRANLCDQLLVTRTIEHDDDEIFDVSIQGTGDRAQVLGGARIEAH